MINKKGLNINEVFDMYSSMNRVDQLSENYHECSLIEMINKCEADIFIELSPLSIKDGEPAISYIEEVFNNNMHVITANKGPVAWDFKRLFDISQNKKLEFLYETTVMDGTPTFNLFKDTLHGNKVSEITGILNGSSNYV